MDIGSSAAGRYDTGDERVDRALDRLADLDSADVSAHAPIYDDVQRSLAAVLDDAPAVPAEQ
jgi:hypothetical protein